MIRGGGGLRRYPGFAPVGGTATHILQITNHGLHDWQVVPGLPDTGGQNVYVNEVTDSLVRLGHRVMIVNRGGYPHPSTGELRTGSSERPEGGARLVYLTDTAPEFVRKEDMASQLPDLATSLAVLMAREEFDLIISHYWDGAMLGILAAARLARRAMHVWVPHSLGAVKRRNVDPAEWDGLRIDERIEAERAILSRVDAVAATSAVIRDSLRDDYGHEARFFLPPGIDEDRYHPRAEAECPRTFELLASRVGRPVDEISVRPIILEVSRTDTTKRKDVLIRAFAEVRKQVPYALLALTIDPVNRSLHDELTRLIASLELSDHVAILGSVWEDLPCLYAMSAAYCTPSIMEGFGMSAEEAAASGTPVVASDLVPFVIEYLLGDDVAVVPCEGGELRVGSGAIAVPSDSVDGFAKALTMLLEDHELRIRMGGAARAVTVPDFAWDRLVGRMMDSLGDSP